MCSAVFGFLLLSTTPQWLFVCCDLTVSRIGTVPGTPQAQTSPSVSRTLSWSGYHASTSGYVPPSTSSTSAATTRATYAWVSLTKLKLWVMKSLHYLISLHVNQSVCGSVHTTSHFYPFTLFSNLSSFHETCCSPPHRLLAFFYGLTAGQMFFILSGKEVMGAPSPHQFSWSAQPC